MIISIVNIRYTQPIALSLKYEKNSSKFKSALHVPVNNTVSNATSVAFPLKSVIFFVNQQHFPQIGIKHFITSFAIKNKQHYIIWGEV